MPQTTKHIVESFPLTKLVQLTRCEILTGAREQGQLTVNSQRL